MTSIITSGAQSLGTAHEIRPLDDIGQSLEDFFNRTYPTANDEEYRRPRVDHFGRRNPDDEEILIELPDNVLDHVPAARAVATLLKITGSHDAWVRHVDSQLGDLASPLRFRLEKRAA